MFEPKGIQLIGTIATAIDRHLKRSQFVQDSVVDPGIGEFSEHGEGLVNPNLDRRPTLSPAFLNRFGGRFGANGIAEGGNLALYGRPAGSQRILPQSCGVGFWRFLAPAIVQSVKKFRVMGRWLIVKIEGDPRVFVVEFSETETMTHVAKYFADNYPLVPRKGGWVYAQGSRNLSPRDTVDSLPHMSRLALKSNRSEDPSSIARPNAEELHKGQTAGKAAAACRGPPPP